MKRESSGDRDRMPQRGRFGSDDIIIGDVGGGSIAASRQDGGDYGELRGGDGAEGEGEEEEEEAAAAELSNAIGEMASAVHIAGKRDDTVLGRRLSSLGDGEITAPRSPGRVHGKGRGGKSRGRGKGRGRGVQAKQDGFGGKHGSWRQRNADPDLLWKPCASEFQGNGSAKGGDKKVQDCESWCRPKLKAAHCRHCKCRACLSCHNGSAAKPKWALGSHQACVRFGRCEEWRREQGERLADRISFWLARRQSVSGGALCNSSADCSGNGACHDGTNEANHTAVGHQQTKHTRGPLKPAPRLANHRCWCSAGYSGARCAHRSSFSSLEGGGAACNQSSDCGERSNSCLSGRCVCGKGWIGAKCSYPS